MIYIIGIGPGNPLDMTFRAHQNLSNVDMIFGYKTYIDLIKDSFPGKEMISTGMMAEIDRCKMVLEKAKESKDVAIISSGDSGVYGMAGLMLEIIKESGEDIEVCVVPGVTAFLSAAAKLGAPIMHDFAIISLSDLMTPWEQIEKRLEAAANADFVIGLYNPKSKERTWQIEKAKEILLKSRSGDTPVGIVRNSTRENEMCITTSLEDMTNHEIDMTTVIIIGNSTTFTNDGKIITPRGYQIHK